MDLEGSSREACSVTVAVLQTRHGRNQGDGEKWMESFEGYLIGRTIKMWGVDVGTEGEAKVKDGRWDPGLGGWVH